MSVFDTINNTTDKATELGETYIKKTRDYYKLKVFQQLSFTFSMLWKTLIVGSVLFIGFIFLAFAAAFAIGQWLNDQALGYLIVAGFFFIVAFLIYKLRNAIDRRIIRTMLPKFFDS